MTRPCLSASNNGKAKFSDLQAALEGNSAFAALFEVKVDADPASLTGGACGRPANSALAINAANADTTATGLVRGVAASETDLANGVTKVAIQVTFNAYISAHDDDELLNDVLAATAERVRIKTTDPEETLATAIGRVRAALNLETSDLGTVTYPTTKVTYSATTDSTVNRSAAMLPMVRDLVVTTAVADADDTDTTVDETIDVATGYADNDTNTAAQNEAMNGPSQVRIGRSSGVKAPS